MHDVHNSARGKKEVWFCRDRSALRYNPSVNNRNASGLARWLGLLSFPALLVSLAALQDIYHGEADVMLEWGALRVAFAIMIAFHVAALFALWNTPGRERRGID